MRTNQKDAPAFESQNYEIFQHFIDQFPCAIPSGSLTKTLGEIVFNAEQFVMNQQDALDVRTTHPSWFH